MFDFVQRFADYIIYNLLNLSPNTHLAQSLNFFVYDSIKIFILLILIVHLMTVINHLLPIEKIRNFLAKNNFWGFEYIFASIFGAITPFCSCSSIPMFVWFLRAWIPLWITFTFLITSPLINEVAVAMFIWLFWIKITLTYIISGILLGILGWWAIWKLKMEDQVADFITKSNNNNNVIEGQDQFNLKSFSKQIIKDSFLLIFKIMPYVLIWVAVWGFIHWFIPEWFFDTYITKENIFAVPLAVLIWIPMYANAAWIIPVVKSLIVAGIPLWTALAFMMAVVGLSLPEFLILKKVMKMKLLLTFFWLVWVFMIILGYIFNLLF